MGEEKMQPYYPNPQAVIGAERIFRQPVTEQNPPPPMDFPVNSRYAPQTFQPQHQPQQVFQQPPQQSFQAQPAFAFQQGFQQQQPVFQQQQPVSQQQQQAFQQQQGFQQETRRHVAGPNPQYQQQAQMVQPVYQVRQPVQPQTPFVPTYGQQQAQGAQQSAQGAQQQQALFNPFDVLGISRTTTDEDVVHNVYRKHVMILHPDRQGDAKQFQVVTR